MWDPLFGIVSKISHVCAQYSGEKTSVHSARKMQNVFNKSVFQICLPYKVSNAIGTKEAGFVVFYLNILDLVLCFLQEVAQVVGDGREAVALGFHRLVLPGAQEARHSGAIKILNEVDKTDVFITLARTL